LLFIYLQFFFPLSIMNVAINYNADGRPSGDADVDFATEDDARMAMKRNRAVMRKLDFANI
jgi:RNA recognition motif-containing protein